MTSKTILIADDDRDLVEVLKMRCCRLGTRVVTAYDSMTALTLIHQERPDLVCLDVGMPAGDGLSVCEMLHADKELSSTAVIMLTGRADEQTIRRCHEMCVYYVLKSSNVWNRLEPIIRELLGLPSSDQDQRPVPASPPAAEEVPRTYPTSGRMHRGLSGLCRVLAQDSARLQDAKAVPNPAADLPRRAVPLS
ncbi:MAG: response regulator [Pirellulales bacterium]|nr:response regulator [Pirellulales bacterium]